MGNGLIELDVSTAGLLALRDCDGREQLSAPLHLERYRDRGEPDAWDLGLTTAPIPWAWCSRMTCNGSISPLVAHLALRRQLGASCGG